MTNLTRNEDFHTIVSLELRKLLSNAMCVDLIREERSDDRSYSFSVVIQHDFNEQEDEALFCSVVNKDVGEDEARERFKQVVNLYN
jgi:hypothetical protein